MGTPTYMSPEQCRSTKNVSFKTDIYALGCILVEMCTGSPPYDARNVYDIMAMHCDEDTQPSLGRMNKQLKAIAATCLAKTPASVTAASRRLRMILRRWLGCRPSPAWWLRRMGGGDRADPACGGHCGGLVLV